MSAIPKTSIALLAAVANDPDSRRWEDFYSRYSPLIEHFLKARFPYLNAEEVIQETMIIMLKILPNYHYAPKEKGHFSDFMIGVAKRKAFEACRRCARDKKLKEKYAAEPADLQFGEDEVKKARLAAIKVGVGYLLKDDTIKVQTREIFRRVAIEQERPEEVANAFGVSRNNVDQIKARMIDKLRKKVVELTGVLNDDPTVSIHNLMQTEMAAVK